MGRDGCAVIIYDAKAYASSEAEVNRAVLRLLPSLYLYDGILPNPLELPETPYDLWAVYPFECRPTISWEMLSDNAEARIAIDITDQFPGMDLYLTTVPMTLRNDSVDRLLRLWGVLWRGEPIQPEWRWGYQRPHLPYVHACADEIDVPKDAPLPHVIWNVEHWADNKDEHSFAEAALSTLAGLGVRTIFQTRADRGGPVTGIAERYGLETAVMVPPEEPDGVKDALWEQLAATQFAYLVSVPSLGMLSIPKALARGIPVVGAPAGRWSEWMSSPAQLTTYRAHPNLYEQARWQAYHTFSDDRAAGQFELAVLMARALRGEDRGR